jgi:signal transduction histidine kinase/CheY-like chemotaxis protein
MSGGAERGSELERLRAIASALEQSGSGVVEIDRAGGERWSPQAMRALGLPEESGGRASDQLIGLALADDRGTVERVLRGEVEGWIDFRTGVGADIRHLRAHCTVQRNAAGVTRVLLLLRDVTVEVAEEQGLRDQLEAVQRAEELASVGSWVFDVASGALTWSDGMFRLHGFAPRAFTPAPASGQQLVVPEDRDAVAAHFFELVNGSDDRTVSYKIRRPSGELRQLVGRGFVVSNGGVAVRLYGAVIDVTELSRLKEQLVNAHKADNLSRIAGSLAHDFNNALTAILANVNLARRRLDGESAARAVSGIEEAANRARELSRRLLAFSSREVMRPQVVSPSALIGDLERLLRRLVGAEIRFVIDADPEAGTVLVDPGQLEQVVLNLVVNGRDAMPGGGTLTLEVRQRSATPSGTPDSPPVPHVMIAVTDTGQGIDAQTRARLFEPFFRNKDDLGAGVGLATSLAIVQDAGGRIDVHSSAGNGSRFEVFLPRCPDAAARPPAWKPAPFTDATVLLCDDDAGVRAVLMRALDRLGYTVLEAVSAEWAARIAAEHDGPIHLLVTDLILPGMDGRQLVHEIRRHRPDLPALIISGETERLLDPPPDTAFMAKPLGLSTLGELIASIVASRAPSAARP